MNNVADEQFELRFSERGGTADALLHFCYNSRLPMADRRRDAFLKRVRAFARGVRRIHDGDDDVLHRTRVSSRRLREWLPLLGLEPESSRKLSRRLRRVTRHLGVLRELDVSVRLVEELSGDARYSVAALACVSTELTDDRTAARERVAAKLPVDKMERLAARLRRAAKRRRSGEERNHASIRTVTPASTGVWAVEARVTRRATRVQFAIDAANSAYLPERLHDVRIALKKLRYAVELLPPANRQPVRADLIALRRTLNLLGRMCDRETLIARARRVQASLSPLDLAAWHQLGALVRALEADCRRLHSRYLTARPRLLAMTMRMSASGRGAAALMTRRVV